MELIKIIETLKALTKDQLSVQQKRSNTTNDKQETGLQSGLCKDQKAQKLYQKDQCKRQKILERELLNNQQQLQALKFDDALKQNIADSREISLLKYQKPYIFFNRNLHDQILMQLDNPKIIDLHIIQNFLKKQLGGKEYLQQLNQRGIYLMIQYADTYYAYQNVIFVCYKIFYLLQYRIDRKINLDASQQKLRLQNLKSFIILELKKIKIYNKVDREFHFPAEKVNFNFFQIGNSLQQNYFDN